MKIQKSWERYGLLTPTLFAVVYLFLGTYIALNFGRPMWYDEVWRPYLISNNMHIPLQDNQGLAPITPGVFLASKLVFLFANNNFTARLLTYVCVLLLPVVVYRFCLRFFDRKMARVMIVVSALSGYVLEFAVQDKPYIMDIVITLLLILAYDAYRRGRWPAWKLAVACIAGFSFSLTAAFTFAVIYGLLLYDCWRQRDKKRAVSQVIVPAGAIAGAALLSYVLFLKPQLSSKLLHYYKSLYPSGNLFQIVHSVVGNFLSIFGLDWWTPLGAGFETNKVFWTNTQLIIAHKPRPLGLATVIGLIFFGLFIYGSIVMWRQKKRLVLIFLAGILGLELIAGIVKVWAFGNSRTNVFSLFLILIVTTYGGYQAVAYAVRKHQLAMLVVALLVAITTFPYVVVSYALTSQDVFSDGVSINTHGAESGGQAIATYVARHSKRGDLVIVNSSVEQYPFRYYWEYSDYTRPYRTTRAQTVAYGLPKHDKELLGKVAGQPNIWAVTASSYSINHQAPAIHGYRPSQTYIAGDMWVTRMVRQ